MLTWRKLGFGVNSFIRVEFVPLDETLTRIFETTVNDCPEVTSCHNISGATDFLVIFAARTLVEYGKRIGRKLRKIPGITDITSNKSLRELKSAFRLPL